jgi:hypothetical protein
LELIKGRCASRLERPVNRLRALTIRLKLLKIGAQITIAVRRVKIALASSYPGQQIFALAHARLNGAPA